MIDGFWKSLVASLAMGSALVLMLGFLTSTSVLLRTLLGIGAGLTIFGICALLLKVREAQFVLHALKKRLAS